MATVHRFKGFSVRIYTNDHRPAHVHVIGSDGEAIFNLHCPGGPPELREFYGSLSRKELQVIADETQRVLSALYANWGIVHGHD